MERQGEGPGKRETGEQEATWQRKMEEIILDQNKLLSCSLSVCSWLFLKVFFLLEVRTYTSFPEQLPLLDTEAGMGLAFGGL